MRDFAPDWAKIGLTREEIGQSRERSQGERRRERKREKTTKKKSERKEKEKYAEYAKTDRAKERDS